MSHLLRRFLGRYFRVVCAAIFTVCLPGICTAARAAAPPTFERDVRPILKTYCLDCHGGGEKLAGNLDLRLKRFAVKGGDTGPAIVPGNASASLLIERLKAGEMPPSEKKVPADKIPVIEQWIAAGAPWGSALAPVSAANDFPYEVWTFDRLRGIAGYPTHVEGHPRVIETSLGKAVEFSGVDDALFIERHPLAGAAAFTWELIFRPDEGGRPEQRVFHLQERDGSGGDTANRMLFEIRVQGKDWYLDSFFNSTAGSKAMLNVGKLHPLGRWYHVAQVYDGREYRNYVDGVPENLAVVKFSPQGDGHSSAGVRINRKDYFKGAIRQAKFTHGALKPEEFLKAERDK